MMLAWYFFVPALLRASLSTSLPSTPSFLLPDSAPHIHNTELAQDAMRIMLQNPDVHGLSAKELIDLSRVNVAMKDWMQTLPSWKYLRILMQEPCYSSGFADNAFYIPPRWSISEKLKLELDAKWDWRRMRLSGVWDTIEQFNNWKPTLTLQEDTVLCLERVLEAGLNVELTVKRRQDNSPLVVDDDSLDFGNMSEFYHSKPLNAAKEWLLNIAIQRNSTLLLDYLLSPQQQTDITSRHFKLAAANQNDKVYRQLLHAKLHSKHTAPLHMTDMTDGEYDYLDERVADVCSPTKRNRLKTIITKSRILKGFLAC